MKCLKQLVKGSAVVGSAIVLTACGSSGSSTTEQGALDNLRSVLASYNAATPTDVASAGSACAQALSGLGGSSFLAAAPGPGKELAVRQEVHAAYVSAREGFSDCALGARTMNYQVMARGDAELMSANGSLQKARSNGG
jgi:hypothetical protein